MKNELDTYGYVSTIYTDRTRSLVLDVMQKFYDFSNQSLDHKNHMYYQNTMGYENRNKTIDPEFVDNKESFYIKENYKFPHTFSPSAIDEDFVLSCKTLLSEVIELVEYSTGIFSKIAGVDLSQYFDMSALTLRAIHYYPDTNFEIAHHHVDRGGQTYHLFETTDGLEAYWNGKWSKIIFDENQMIYFPCIQAQFASRCILKGLSHRVISTDQSVKDGRYSLVLFVDYNKLPYKYSFSKKGPIEKALFPGQNYDMNFSELENYFENKSTPKFRKGVSALIMNNKDEFLLVNLESFETKYFAIPGGGIEPHETLENAVYREVEEELGIAKNRLQLVNKSKKPLQFLFKTKKLNRDGVNYDGSERHFFGFRFIGDDKEIKLQKGEVRSYKWVKFEELKNYLLFENQIEETTDKLFELFPFIKI